MGKINRADLMRSSIKAEEKSVVDRFAAADAVMDRHPGGLAKPVGGNQVESTNIPTGSDAAPVPTFSAESPAVAAVAVASSAPPGVAPLPDQNRIIEAPISKVHDNPYNARAVYVPEKIKERAASIAADGQKTPAHAMEHPDRPGEYILLDGHYRKKGLLHLGRDTIRLTVDPSKDKFEMYRISRLLNVQRDDQTALDDAIVWSRMKADGLFSNDEDIAEKLGISIGSVSKTLAMLKLESPVLDKVKEAPHKFGVAMGYEVYLCSKVMSQDDLLKLVDDIIEKDLPTREVQSIRERLETNKPRKAKEVNRIYKLRSGSNQIGSFKVSEAGKVALEVTIADPRERAALIEEIKRRFGVEDDGA